MALPSSGNPISMSQVNVELNYSSTATITLNDSNVRALFQKTGFGTTISMSDGYGKSNAVVGQAEWGTAGTYSWTVPAGVTSICAVGVNAGDGGYSDGGGNGGNLFYKNSISVSAGETLTIYVGTGGSGGLYSGGSGAASSILRSGTTLLSQTVYNYLSTGGGGVSYGGGGGAGGYQASGQVATGGSGGSESSDGGGGYYGAGGGGGGGWDDGCWNRSESGNGGKVYAYGRGDAGSGGQGGDENYHNEGYNGANGSYSGVAGSGTMGSVAGGAGGGGGGYSSPDCGSTLYRNYGKAGSAGFIRIIWTDGSVSRSFPVTNTKNL